jgi:hypothetical protein
MNRPYSTSGGPLKHFSLTDGGATLCHTITADIKHYQHSVQYLQLQTGTCNFVDPMTRHCVNHGPHFKNLHYEFILVINQLDVQNLFYNKFISCLYMFRAPCPHRQKVKIVLYSLWYHHTYRWLSRAQDGHL